MDKLLLTPMEAADMLGVGRSKVYELMRAGALGSVPDRQLPAHPGRGPQRPRLAATCRRQLRSPVRTSEPEALSA